MALKTLLAATDASSGVAVVWQDLGAKRTLANFMLIFTGTLANGTINVKVANEDDKSDAAILPEAALLTGAPAEPSGAAVNVPIMLECSFRYVGVEYIDSPSITGAGTMAVNYYEKF